MANPFKNITILAVMTEGALYCTDHADFDKEDVITGHVTLVTQFDVDCGTPQAEWLTDACCAGCGTSF